MVLYNLGSQAVTEFSTSVILVLSVLLSIFLTQAYTTRKSLNYASWSIGLWLFTAGVLEEILFSAGIYSQFLIKSYLVIVAILVQFLAMGSLQLTEYGRARFSYYLYSIATTAIILFVMATTSLGNVISNYVVFGVLPLAVIVSSSMITVPAAIIILVVAVISYRKTHSHKMLSIITGVVVVSIAGTLYIAKFPAFLYYAEFIGILLLWIGFFSPARKNTPLVSPHS